MDLKVLKHNKVIGTKGKLQCIYCHKCLVRHACGLNDTTLNGQNPKNSIEVS